MNFETRTGPDLGDAAPVYPAATVPEWYRDAKLGFFVHWGLYSVPAWAPAHPPGGVPAEDAYAHHQYAEWYANTVRIPGSPTWRRHQEIYGPGCSYEDLADRWDAGGFDADAFVGELVGAGARYVVPTTKHHDGFCLWDTATTTFNAARRGPRRDLIGEFHDATRRAGARFGVYYSGALDWHVGDFPPIESDTDLFRFRRHDDAFARYAAAQLEELVTRFRPDVLWNDIEWPDGGKGAHEHGLAALFRRYFEAVPDGAINDRWGVPRHGYLTREYTHVEGVLDTPWESTRGLGYSFGYNQAEDATHSLSGAALIRLLADVVSKNGNLLINVGPRADGSIPDLQLAAMRELGAWLRRDGDAVYGTRPWVRAAEETGAPRAYTARPGIVNVIALDPAAGLLDLPVDLAEGTARWADGSLAGFERRADGGVDVVIPDALRGDAAAAVSITMNP
ncbi:alpha-L-fucosidase [Microbacterium sp. zg.Y1090]|uniref:alpha-L-fucosidase n=1 Tax=Microbacterium wangruii TaxID=3049073 RepID=UPI00214DC9BE|nr:MULTISPECIES: alpha-L-fucosidase [unclassified Microbacterium]MCR2819004.1 alpha-L-fucosidase [Microbacterium sp. zg.Y1090]MDL5487654.1 alpha-L-fucosidase [Microbacterium sp. zg-Y1211]WIM27309.1 alpha-L-fucosidase [Microbacterium sp. zg-Y1090]